MSPSTGLTAQGCWLLAVGGGGTAGDWRFRGCEGGLMRTRSLPSPGRSGSTHPVLLSPPARSACCLLFPLHPSDCSPSAIYHFSSSFYGQREVFLIYEKVFTVLSRELSWAQAGKRNFGKCAGELGNIPLTPQGQRRLTPAPSSECHTNTQRPCCVRNNSPPPSSSSTQEHILAPRKGTDGGWETSCAPWDRDLPFARGRGAQGARMLPRQEGIKRSVWPKSCTPRNKQKLQTWGLGVPPIPSRKPGMPDPALLKGSWGQGQQPWGRPRWECALWLRLGFLTQVLGGFSSRTWFTGPLPTDKILLLYIGRLTRRWGLGLSRLVAVQVPDSPVPSLP